MNAETDTGLTGLVDASRIRALAGRIPQTLIERLLKLQDLSSTASDVLDRLGFDAALGASQLVPAQSGHCVVGTAVTVRKVPVRRSAALGAAQSEIDMGEIEGVNQCRPGDVLVMQALPEISAMGGIMSAMAKRQGCAAAIVDGGVRDIAQARTMGFPIWSTSITPVTGKWRSEVVEINGSVSLCGKVVHPGDLVIADDTGVVFVPRAVAAELTEQVENICRKEDGLRLALETSKAPLHELVRAYLSQQGTGRS